MTVRRDPFSIEGAWFDTCDSLGWGFVARELEVSEKLIREWSNPNSLKKLPQWAADQGDVLLAERGRPEYNIKAAAARRVMRDRSPAGQLREVDRDIEIFVRIIETAKDEGWTIGEITKLITGIVRKCITALDLIVSRQDRNLADEQAAKPHETKLRAVSGDE